MATYDILIVGAGIAGASAAYEMAPYARVVLLEREDQPGYHTTGRSAAMFVPGYGNGAVRALTAASRAFYEADAGGLADHPVLARPRGFLIIGRADQIATLDRMLAETRAQRPELQRLDARATLALMPVLRPDYVAGGLFDPEAMDMDVAAIHQGYLKGFRARGGRLVTGAEVLAIEGDGPPWRVTTRAGRFEAAVLVDAAGAWADRVAALAGAEPVGLQPKRRTAIHFEPSARIDPAWPMVDDADERFYFKWESGLLLGSPGDAMPMEPCDVQPEELDVAHAVDRIERATTFRVLRVARKWAGLRTFAPDGPVSSGWPARAVGASRPRRPWHAPRPSSWSTASCPTTCWRTACAPKTSSRFGCGTGEALQSNLGNRGRAPGADRGNSCHHQCAGSQNLSAAS
jgi:D-arginine dehydrogenase